MDIRIQLASPSNVERLKPELVEIYRRAFSIAPYTKTRSEVDEFEAFLPIHAKQNGFRLVIAIASETGKSVGFAYGRTVTKGQPWYDIVRGPLESAGLMDWLANAFQIVEMAVDPRMQSRGVGGRLHDHLSQGLPHRRAVLTTIAHESAAYHLYRSKGWRVLLNGITVPGYPRPYRVMGLELRIAGVDAASTLPAADAISRRSALAR